MFAKILRGEIPAFKVYEDAQALSFMDAMPQSDGHTLVIPKTEARNFFDIAPRRARRLDQGDAARRHGACSKPSSPTACASFNSTKPAAGQTVFHIHFHIVPCYEGVEIRGHGRDWADKALLAQQAEKVRAALSHPAAANTDHL